MFYRIIFYSRKFSNSSIKQNSPNVLFTVKKFKLLRLGAPGEARTRNEGVGGPCFIQLDYGCVYRL